MASGGTGKEETAAEASGQSAQPEKHPLHNKWSLWYFKADKSKEWKENMKLVTAFDTVEDFWAIYNHIKPPSQLTTGCDYMLFKEGIQPMWEDKKNKAGGRWLLNFDKRRDTKQTVDNCWMETLMCLVGEAFNESSDEVCGAFVQIRQKGDKIAIWTGNAKKDADVLVIGRAYLEKLEIHMARPSIVYQSHQDQMSKTGSVSKSMHTLSS